MLVDGSTKEFYYMQKAEELKILKEQLNTARINFERTHKRICTHYEEIFHNWKQDVRIVNKTPHKDHPEHPSPLKT